MIGEARISRRTVLAGMAATGLPAVAGAQEPRTLRIWTFLDANSGKDPREKVFRKLIDSFEAANPGVKISVELQNWTQMTDKFFAAHQTGTAPDIMWVIYSRLEAAVTLGALAGLDELLARNKLWTDADYEDMGGPYLQFGSRRNTHYQITHSRSISGMIYRVDQLREAGIDPADLTTWDEFIAAAQKLTLRDASGNVSRWGFGQVFTNVATQPSIAASVMMDRDGRIFDEKGRALWATPAGVEGLTLELDMIRKYKVTPSTALSLNGEDLYDQFTSGHMAMILSNSARTARMQSIVGAEKVSFLPFPSFTKGKSSPTEAQGWPLGIWSGSKQKDLAAKFLAHISSKDADTAWVLEGGAVPMRKSTITGNPDFFLQPTKRYLTVIANVMQRSVWFVPEEEAGGWNEALDRAAQAVMTNGVEPRAALERAQAAFNRANGY